MKPCVNPQKHSVTNEELSEILFRIPEPKMDADHSHQSSESVVNSACAPLVTCDILICDPTMNRHAKRMDLSEYKVVPCARSRWNRRL